MPPSKTQQPAAHDTVFAVETIKEDFVFNQHVVEVFDDMVSRSVPYYDEIQRMLAEMAGDFAIPGT